MAAPTMNSTAHNDLAKEFVKRLGDLQRLEGWRESEAFFAWLEAAARALIGASLVGYKEEWQKNEDSFLRIEKHWQKRADTKSVMAEMTGIVMLALSKDPVDFLSPLFMDVGGSGHLGQFFTPWSVSTMMAEMTVGSKEELFESATKNGRDYISLSEPACGVGGMVLAANEVMRKRGIDISSQILWHCVDVDWRAVCGTFIQTTLTGTPAVVIHGNTLTLQQHSAYMTAAAQRMLSAHKTTPKAA